MGHLVATGAESGLAKSVLTQMILPSRQRLRGDAAAADRPIYDVQDGKDNGRPRSTITRGFHNLYRISVALPARQNSKWAMLSE